MTLTNRLMLFFVGALATVLAGFSFGLYLTAHHYLYHQATERLAALERVLVAAIELEPDGADWEPTERTVKGPDGGYLWQLLDENGKIVDGIPAAEDVLPEFAKPFADGMASIERLDRDGRPWRVTNRKIVSAARPEALGSGKHASFTIIAGVPLGPVRDALNKLAAVLVGLSVAVLVLTLFVGRSVCRRALAPVARMAAAALAMDATNLDERLPVAPVKDELADLGKSFNGLLDRLHESFERQRRFTGDASHQLRTPLAAILGQAEVALRRDRSADDYRETLEAVRKQANHVTRIVEALLFLARLEAEAGAPAAERLDLAAWLPEHLRSWADKPRAADLSFEDAAGGPANVQVPPALLGELVNNLLDNAFKYSEPGSPVTIRIARAPGAVTIAIEDCGAGIHPGDLTGLFRPFFRSDDARRRGVPGVGLGLAVAARLAKAFGGDITVISELGQGSTFRIRLPACEPLAA